ncbi:MAG: hypothetical protein AB8E15_04065 [Bdellovibrionales bacterium]
MRLLVVMFLSLVSCGLMAEANCIDSNLNSLEPYVRYNKVAESKDWNLDYEGRGVAPAEYSEFFFVGNVSRYCNDIGVSYLTHIPSGQKYVVYATLDDSCDGGNAIGVMVNLATYKAQGPIKAFVAEIGDTELFCKE